jgi:hypothetical protein
VLGLAASVTGGTRAAARAVMTARDAITAVPSPGQSARLSAVTEITPKDAWAVGGYCTKNCAGAVSITNGYSILHWNGTAWRLAATGACAGLNGVSGATANDVWAVGACFPSVLLLHWNGAKWVRLRPAGLGVANLMAVSAVSTKSAWAVGTIWSAKLGGYTTLAMHWNGRAWSREVSPTIGGRAGGSALTQVTADRANDAWAVGQYCASGCGSASEVERVFVLHWNGRAWVRSSLPLSSGFASASAFQALSPTNAWLLGFTLTSHVASPFLLHWTGVKWQRVANPSGGATAMTFTSAANGWLLGLGAQPAHWNGSAWTLNPAPLPNLGGGINGADGTSASDIWAVGERCVSLTSHCGIGGFITRDLIMHFNGTKWAVA